MHVGGRLARNSSSSLSYAYVGSVGLVGISN